MDDSTKQLVEILMQSNGQFKDMLVFAVGSIVTLIALFLTANFFTMRSFRNEEIARIKSEIELNIKNDSINLMKEELKKELEKSLTTFKQRTMIEIESIGDHLNSLESIQKEEHKSTSENIIDLKAKLLELEGDFWRDNQITLNAIDLYIESGNTLKVLDNPDYLGVLDKIDECLDELDEPLSNFIRANIQELISNIKEPEYMAQINIIQEKISKAMSDKRQINGRRTAEH